MSDLAFAFTNEDVTVDTTLKCVGYIKAPANHRVIVDSISFYFQGTQASAEPAIIQVVRVTHAAEDGVAWTPQKQDSDLPETLLTTGQKPTFTTAPTVAAIVDVIRCHVQAGLREYLPYNKEWKVGGGVKFGLFMKVPASTQVVTISLRGEE